MTLFVKDAELINRLDNLFARYAGISGLKINRDKTFIMLLGPPTDINIKFPFGKVVQMIKILGVVFYLDTETRERLNYKESSK